MALYEIVLDASYFNQSCINRWNYTSTGSSGSITGSQALMSAMGFLPTGVDNTYPANTLFDAIRTLQTTEVLYTQVIAKNLYDPTDFWTASFIPDTRGKVAQLGLSPTIAFGFRTNRVRSDIDRGTKRFVGVPYDTANAGGVFKNSAQDLMQIVATFMTGAVTWDADTSNITFTPAIVQKQKYVVPNSDPARYAYRYYPTLAEQQSHLAQGFTWEIYTTQRTQTSRQYGKGA